MSVTLDVLWCLLVTHLAALRCTISSECFCLEMCGSQTVAAYSRCGRTSVLNSFSFVELDRVLIFLLTNASCWFALALMMSMWMIMNDNGDTGVVINFFRPWSFFHLPWLYRLYYPLCVSRRIDTWQIVYLSNKDPCPKISIHKSEIEVPWTAMEIHKFQHPQSGSP